MGNVFSFDWENQLIIGIQKYMSDTMTGIASFITEFGDAMILVAIVGLFYWSLNKNLGKRLFIYLSLANIVNPCIKCLVRRMRPYMVNNEIECLKPVNNEGDIYDIVSQEYSFPSGHAVNSVSVYGTLLFNLKNKVWKILFGLLILLVGISRFSLGVHYPTDILAGWAVALICVIIYDYSENKLGKYKTYILFDIIGLFGFFIAETNDFFTGYGMMLGGTLGIIFEEKYVKFDGTKKILTVVIRTIIGAGLYLGLNELLKLPFTTEFLNSGTLLSFSIRAARYAIVVFVLIGVYPLSFKLTQFLSNSKK